MEQSLKDFYANWLVKHKAPEDHPHRELFDKLVEELNNLDKYTGSLSMNMVILSEQLGARLTALEQFAKAPMQAYTPEPEEFTR